MKKNLITTQSFILQNIKATTLKFAYWFIIVRITRRKRNNNRSYLKDIDVGKVVAKNLSNWHYSLLQCYKSEMVML